MKPNTIRRETMKKMIEQGSINGMLYTNEVTLIKMRLMNGIMSENEYETKMNEMTRDCIVGNDDRNDVISIPENMFSGKGRVSCYCENCGIILQKNSNTYLLKDKDDTWISFIKHANGYTFRIIELPSEIAEKIRDISKKEVYNKILDLLDLYNENHQ